MGTSQSPDAMMGGGRTFAEHNAGGVNDDTFTQSSDGKVWAEEFVRRVRATPSIATDESTMLGWFANAIMRGYDVHAAKVRGVPGAAVYGFAGWLTCREEAVTFGATHECGGIAQLVAAYCASQGYEVTDEAQRALSPYPTEAELLDKGHAPTAPMTAQQHPGGINLADSARALDPGVVIPASRIARLHELADGLQHREHGLASEIRRLISPPAQSEEITMIEEVHAPGVAPLTIRTIRQHP